MNLLEDTGGCGSLLLSLSADARSADYDDVIAFEGTNNKTESRFSKRLRLLAST